MSDKFYKYMFWVFVILTFIRYFILSPIEKKLNALPYTERRGRWEHYEHREPRYDIMGVKTWAEAYKCSNCGFIHSFIEDFGHYAFCPNCGAKMDEVEE